jgi:hypothetical protein
MRLRLGIIAGLVVFAAWGIRYQCGTRVLAKQESSSGGEFIIVREIQLKPLSLKGLFRFNPMVYRFEYYPNADWPMLTAQGFSGESYVVRSVKIEWKAADVAIVTIDQAIAFECAQGQWRKIAL